VNREQLAHILRAASTIVDDPNILVIGRQSVLATLPFHEMNGVYAQGVSVRTAVLPEGWRGRVVPWSNQSTGRALAAFLEPHACVVSKLVAYREKDFASLIPDLRLPPIMKRLLARDPRCGALEALGRRREYQCPEP
jgi:hypothetical protein